MMKFKGMVLAAMLAAALPFAPAFAHGDIHADHGGQAVEADGRKLELVVADGKIDVYVSDHDDKPLAAKDMTGKAVLLAAGKKLEVPLAPAGGNRLSGAAQVAAGTKASAIVTVEEGGKKLSARFAAN